MQARALAAAVVGGSAVWRPASSPAARQALPHVSQQQRNKADSRSGQRAGHAPPVIAAVAAAAGAARPSPGRNAAAFKKAVRAGQLLTGLFLDSASPLIAEQMAALEPGYDYLVVDMQHAPTDRSNLAAMITAINAGGKAAVVRVEGPGDRGGIQQALDLGAAGLIVPTVFTAADVERVISAAYYPSAAIPTGSRSIAWPIRPQLGRAVPEFLAAANDEVTVMVQIETKQSLDELESVLSVSQAGVDCAFVGPVDLSHALGLAQSHGFPACFDAPEFKAALAQVAGVCRGKGVAAGNFAVTPARAEEFLAMGYSVLATGTDVGLLGDAAAANAKFAAGLRAR